MTRFFSQPQDSSNSTQHRSLKTLDESDPDYSGYYADNEEEDEAAEVSGQTAAQPSSNMSNPSP